MAQMTDIVLAFFMELNWQLTPIEGRPIFRMEFASEKGEWSCLVHVREEMSQVLFYSVYPHNAPTERRLALAELLTRANYGMANGNFEMDFTDGEIRYKTYIDTQGEPLLPGLLKGLVYANLATMRMYFPAITVVLNGESTPEDAVAVARGS
jgi:hypothetical protein